jgi:hypothetical protein
MDDPKRCKKNIYDSWHPHQCKLKLWKDGFCKIHHPESVKIRNEKNMKEWEEKQKNSPLAQLERAINRIRELERENEVLRNTFRGLRGVM